MANVLLDLNALIGVQLPHERSMWEALLADPQHRLIITDHTLLEMFRAGELRMSEMLLPLVPHASRIFASCRHSELMKIECERGTPAGAADLFAGSVSTNRLRSEIAKIALGANPFTTCFQDPCIVKELQHRLSPEETQNLLRTRIDALRHGIAMASREMGRPQRGKESLKAKFCLDVFEDGHIDLCMRLARDSIRDQLLEDGVHWIRAKNLASLDSFWLRHELTYWLRCLQLLQGNRLENWDHAGRGDKAVNEHFDVEFIAMASMADIAACKDGLSKDTLAMLSLAFEREFGPDIHMCSIWPPIRSEE